MIRWLSALLSMLFIASHCLASRPTKVPYPERYPLWEYNYRFTHHRLTSSEFDVWMKNCPDPRNMNALIRETPLSTAKQVAMADSVALLKMLQGSKGELRQWAAIEACFRADMALLPTLTKMALAEDMNAAQGLIMFKSKIPFLKLYSSKKDSLKVIAAVYLASLDDARGLSTVLGYLRATQSPYLSKKGKAIPLEYANIERGAWRRSFREDATYDYIRLSPKLSTKEVMQTIRYVGARYILPRLVQIKSKPVVDALYAFANDKEAYARKWALIGITKLPDSPRRTAALKKGLADPWKDVVAVAKWALDGGPEPNGLTMVRGG